MTAKHGRPPIDNPSNVLRSALAGPFPTLRLEAQRLIKRALRGRTRLEAATELGVSERLMYDLIRDAEEKSA